jgi:hypothetical protein
MIGNDEYLERIVAGIQSVSADGADVRWSERINGRQFDVVVRFRLGTLSYLVVIEVKNRARKAGVEDLEAFVTKVRDQNANKAVFVTAAGFQSGAIDVAKRHGIDLFTVTFDENEFKLPQEATFVRIRNPNAPEDAVPEFSIGEPEFVVAIEKLTLIYADGARHDVPTERSQMNYYCINSSLSDGRSLWKFVESVPLPEVALDETLEEQVTLESALNVTPPDTYFFPAGELKAVVLKISGKMGRPMLGNIKIDPNLFAAPVVYTNAITGEETRFDLDSLPLGFSRVSPGNFYFTVHPLAYFYCDAIKGSLVHWVLVETFQNGDLMQAMTKQEVKYSPYYIPVTDRKVLGRLQARLEQYRRR